MLPNTFEALAQQIATRQAELEAQRPELSEDDWLTVAARLQQFHADLEDGTAAVKAYRSDWQRFLRTAAVSR